MSFNAAVDHDDTLAAAERRVGSLLRGKWRLDRVLGVGGMASVYAATHRNGMRGAVKILHADVARSADARARFLREGYLANQVKRGAVKVLDDDSLEDGSVFLVMELLEGQTIEAIAAAQPGERLSTDRVRWIARALLDVLVAAHEVGLIHRDLKPENLFLTTAGELRVLDFGLARLRDASGAARKTTTTSAMGTPAFMPPEQALAEWDRVGPHSDIYAVGATLFTLLTGELTHVANTAAALLVAVASRPARPVRSVLPSCPADLAHAIDRACAFDPAHRWPSAKAMLDAIAPYDPVEPSAPYVARGDSLPDSAELQGGASRFVGARTEAPTNVPTPHPFRAMITVGAVSSDKPLKAATKRAIIGGGVLLAAGATAALVWTFAVRPPGSPSDSGKPTRVESAPASEARAPSAAQPEAPLIEPGARPSAALAGGATASPEPSGVASSSSAVATSSASAAPVTAPPRPSAGFVVPRSSAPAPKSSGLDLSRPD
ncbi:MAG: protein kinase [Polyangiaceae bacterium]